MRCFRLLIILLALAGTASAQLSGIKTIPGSYATISAAVTALNTSGVGAGGVTFNVAAAYSESITVPIMVTATGTAANPIVFQKSGTGANPKVTRTNAGTLTTSVLGGQGDAVIIIQGSDYVTFNGIDVAASFQGIEYGYYLRKAGPANGCINVTIQNAVITMTKGTSAFVVGLYSSNNDASSLVSSATGITLTGTGGRNENLTITGNTVANVFAGILVRGYNHTVLPYDFLDRNCTIGMQGAGNTVQNFAGNVASFAYGIGVYYQTNPSVSFNTVVNTAGGGTNATSAIRGIFLSGERGGDIMTVNNNTITLGQSSTGEATPILANGQGNSITINNNTLSYGTFATYGSNTAYMIRCESSANSVNISGNQTSGIINKMNPGTFYGIYHSGSPTGGTATISNNILSNITIHGTYDFSAIYSSTNLTQPVECAGNVISNITGADGRMNLMYLKYIGEGSAIHGNSIFNITNNAFAEAMSLGYSSCNFMTVYDNLVSNITGTVESVVGINKYSGTTASLYNNRVFNLSVTGAAGVTGINIWGGILTDAYNNAVYDLRAPAATGSNSVIGINVNSGNSVRLFNNTVVLKASGTSTFGSSGIFKEAATTRMELRNNIIVNGSAPGTTSGITAAVRWSGSYDSAKYVATSNNNCLHAGTPASNRLIFYDGSHADQTMADYKARVTPRDLSSFTEDPPFVSASTTPFDVHLSSSAPSQCESGGSAVVQPSVSSDFDGQPRYPLPGYPDHPSFPATGPDVGADEFAGIPNDMQPPMIAYTPLLNTASTLDRILNVTISDPSGVGTGTNLPVLYWKLNTGSYQGPVTPFSVSGNNYQFAFGGGAILGNTVSYFVVAQDNSPNANITSNPTGATLSNNPPRASADPAVPNNYTILGAICGNKTVGAVNADYPTLTAAIADLNARALCGPVTFLLQDAQYPTETYPIVINPNPGSDAVNTVTIKPQPGSAATFVCPPAGTGLIIIRNNYTIIDGSGSGSNTRDLTLSRTGNYDLLAVSSSGTTPVHDVVIRNCILTCGINLRSGVRIGDVSGTAGYFHHITIENNRFQQGESAVYAEAVEAAGNGNGLLITLNDMNSSGSDAIGRYGIYLKGVDGALVAHNLLGNFQGAGSVVTQAITVEAGTINTTVTENEIANLTYSTGATPGNVGIYIATGKDHSNIIISSNTLTNISSSGTNQGSAYGIGVHFFTGGITIEKNRISNIRQTYALPASGILLDSYMTISDITVKNNFISDVYGYGNPSGFYFDGYGINIMYGGGYKLYNNSVSLSVNQVAPTSNPACLMVGSNTTINSVDVRNNIFSITSTVGANRYAVLCDKASTVFTHIDNNVYFTTGPNLGIVGGVNRPDLAAWRTGTGQDANSVSGNPQFISTTDLHIPFPNTSPAGNAGVSLAPAVTDDIDGDVRSNPPDIGADEIQELPACSGIPTACIINGPVGVCYNTNVTLSLSQNYEYAGITYQWKAATTPGGPYTNLGNLSMQSTGNLAQSTWYVCDITCTLSGMTFTTPEYALFVDGSPSLVVTGPAIGVTNDNIPYSVTGFTPGSTFQWQVSPTNCSLHFLDIAGATSDLITYSPGSAGTKYIRCVTTGPYGCISTSGCVATVITVNGDDVCSAIMLSPGLNGPFSNDGATIQPGEPVPPGNGCIVQTGWCTNQTISNSVWFKFTAPPSGRVSIGNNPTLDQWNNQFALYSAPGCASILSGEATLIAANDDSTAQVWPNKAWIAPVCLTPGETYYLQVDGNGANTQEHWGINLSIEPNTPPVFTGCPSNITIPVNVAGCSAIVNWTAPVATDPENCQGQLAVGSNHVPGETFPLGTTSVTYTASDGVNLPVTCSFTVTVVKSTQATISGSTTFCINSSTVLDAGSGYAAYLWSTGATTRTITVKTTGTFSVIVTDVFGCTSTASATTSYLPLPTCFLVTGGGSYCAGGPGVLTGLSGSQPGVNYYLWNYSGYIAGPVMGTGGPISFGAVASPGYTMALAENPVTGCTSWMYNYVIITATQPVPVGVSIVASSNPAPAGQSVTFTAQPVNGGTSPLFQWLVNGQNAGSSSATFTYPPANGDLVSCMVNSNMVCVSGNPAVSNVITMEVNTILPDITVTGIVGSGQSVCYNASQTMTVAGDGTTFQVAGGGMATLIAGERIYFFPGTVAFEGSFLHGYISNTYCGLKAASEVAVVTVMESPEPQANLAFKLFPNPTEGKFTLLRQGAEEPGGIAVVIYSLRGEKMQTSNLSGEMMHEFNVGDLPAGLYFVKITTATKTGILKLVKAR